MNDFPVMALVCSAGGLDALTQVLEPLPAGLPAAVLVLQHVSPGHHSELPAILARRTALLVTAATDGALLAPGRVLVCPPGYHTLITADDTIALIASGSLPPYRPSADLLLTTLAVAAGTQVIAVVLTGNGNDAATGLEEYRIEVWGEVSIEGVEVFCPYDAAGSCHEYVIPAVGEVGAELGDALLGNGSVEVVEVDDSGVVDLREVVLGLGFPEREGVDGSALQVLAVFTERGSGELDDVLVGEAVADGGPGERGYVVGLIDKQVGAGVGQRLQRFGVAGGEGLRCCDDDVAGFGEG